MVEVDEAKTRTAIETIRRLKTYRRRTIVVTVSEDTAKLWDQLVVKFARILERKIHYTNRRELESRVFEFAIVEALNLPEESYEL